MAGMPSFPGPPSLTNATSIDQALEAGGEPLVGALPLPPPHAARTSAVSRKAGNRMAWRSVHSSSGVGRVHTSGAGTCRSARGGVSAARAAARCGPCGYFGPIWDNITGKIDVRRTDRCRILHTTVGWNRLAVWWRRRPAPRARGGSRKGGLEEPGPTPVSGRSGDRKALVLAACHEGGRCDSGPPRTVLSWEEPEPVSYPAESWTVIRYCPAVLENRDRTKAKTTGDRRHEREQTRRLDPDR